MQNYQESKTTTNKFNRCFIELVTVRLDEELSCTRGRGKRHPVVPCSPTFLEKERSQTHVSGDYCRHVTIELKPSSYIRSLQPGAPLRVWEILIALRCFKSSGRRLTCCFHLFLTIQRLSEPTNLGRPSWLGSFIFWNNRRWVASNTFLGSYRR